MEVGVEVNKDQITDFYNFFVDLCMIANNTQIAIDELVDQRVEDWGFLAKMLYLDKREEHCNRIGYLRRYCKNGETPNELYRRKGLLDEERASLIRFASSTEYTIKNLYARVKTSQNRPVYANNEEVLCIYYYQKMMEIPIE